MFQFLLGRLETERGMGREKKGKPFQFLLGRLETSNVCLSLFAFVKFQFLLGRLETELETARRILKEAVSIPLR